MFPLSILYYIKTKQFLQITCQFVVELTSNLH